MRLEVAVNWERHEVVDVRVGESLLYVQLDRLGLPWSKKA